MATIVKSISLSLEFHELASKYHISLSEAVRIGLSIMLSELGEPQFLNKLNLGRKISHMASIIDEQQKKIEEFEHAIN
jgi:hypothetical protein